MEVLECEVGFYNAGSFDPGSKDVLLSGLVVGGSDPIQAVQVAGDSNTEGTMDQALGTVPGCRASPLRAQSPSGTLAGHCANDGPTLCRARGDRGCGR